MLDQLRYLVELQMLENKRTQLIRGCEATPRRIGEIEKEFRQFEGEYLSKKADYEHARKLHRSIEQSIADLETRTERSKGRMNEVKTNKEYQAMLKEIEDIKKEISSKEDEALEVMESIERLSGQVKELEKEVEVSRKKMEEDKQVLVCESEGTKERLDQLEALRQRVREKVDADLLKRCDFLFQKQAGIAVAAVENGVCQVCHMNIPPQKFNELQRDEMILHCPHCHRFLYWPGIEGYQVFEEDLEAI